MSRAYHLKYKYGITEAQYNEILQRQKRSCAVCKRPASGFVRALAVDHDHHTGEIRGLLCDGCNRFVIGRHRIGLGADELFIQAGFYLRGPYTGWFVPPKKSKKKRKKRGKNPPSRSRQSRSPRAR